MENAQIVVVAKALKDKVVKEASKLVEPGRYDVDFLVRFLGSFTKGEEFIQKLSAKINWRRLALVALSKVNVETLKAIVRDFLAAEQNGGDSEEMKKLEEQIKADVLPALEKLMERTETTMSGKVTTDLSVEVVGGGNVQKVA
jgi:hypothetical protein